MRILLFLRRPVNFFVFIVKYFVIISEKQKISPFESIRLSEY